MIWTIIGIIAGLYLLAGIKVINQYERGIRFTLGRYTNIIEPGLNIVFPIIQSYERVDIRTKVIDVPDQDTVTKDNVSVGINAVLYYNISDAKKAILEVEDYDYAVIQIAQTTMRDIVGEVDLDGLLAKREELSKRIQKIVDKATDPWGIKVEAVDLKHINLPQDLVRVMAKAAESEREKRAIIIQADGEVIAAKNMAAAAKKLSSTPGGLHIRTLQTINDLSSDKSNTNVYAVPEDILNAVALFAQKKG